MTNKRAGFDRSHFRLRRNIQREIPAAPPAHPGTRTLNATGCLWNSEMKPSTESQFHFSVQADMAILETVKWISPLRLASAFIMWLQ
jgi:hypothetical protein